MEAVVDREEVVVSEQPTDTASTWDSTPGHSEYSKDFGVTPGCLDYYNTATTAEY